MASGIAGLSPSMTARIDALGLPGATPDNAQTTLASGHTRPGSPLGAHGATLRTGTQASGVDAQREASFARLKQPSLTVAGRILAAVATLVSAPALLIHKGLAALDMKARALFSGEGAGPTDAAVRARNELRTELGRHDRFDADQILNKSIRLDNAHGAGVTSVMTCMEAYVDRLRVESNSSITHEDMQMYVCMGEQIYQSLHENAPTAPPLQIRAGNKTLDVPANLDTARALSWYLQARGIADNAGAGRTLEDVTLVSSGAMIAKDPGNRLYNFLSSAPQCYGRCSSHCQERSAHSGGNWRDGLTAIWKGGILAAAISGAKGQPIQNGIEDFDNRFPSKGGSLLFDKLHDSEIDGVGEIYLKWEEVGTPTAFGVQTKHMDDADGFAARMMANVAALGRNKEHALHFSQDADPTGYHGEKIDKGSAKKIFEDFKSGVNSLAGSVLEKEECKSLITEAKTFGAARMAYRLETLIARAQEQKAPLDHVVALKQVQQDLGDFLTKAGADLGIVRKGQEIHVGRPERENIDLNA